MHVMFYCNKESSSRGARAALLRAAGPAPTRTVAVGDSASARAPDRDHKDCRSPLGWICSPEEGWKCRYLCRYLWVPCRSKNTWSKYGFIQRIKDKFI